MSLGGELVRVTLGCMARGHVHLTPLSGRLLPCVMLGLLLCGCTSMAVRPVYQRYIGRMEFDTRQRDGEYDMRHERRSIEVVAVTDDVEIFFDAGLVDFEDREDGRLDADGYGFGIGVRSPPPDEPGWSLDAGVRLGMHILDFEKEADAVDPDWDYEGIEGDFNLGACYSVETFDELLLSIRGGIYFKDVGESYIWRGAAAVLNGLSNNPESSNSGSGGSNHGSGRPDRPDQDYSMYSTGLYLGSRLNFASSDYFDVNAMVFAGTERMQGLMITAAIRF